MLPESAPPNDHPSLIVAILTIGAFASAMIAWAAWLGMP